MKKIIIKLALISSILGQDCLDDRYINEIYDVDIIQGVEFGSNENDFFGSPVTEVLYMDIYQPSEDSEENRPLIFFLFGGAFVTGSRTSSDIVELCTRYAKRGYVAVAIDYRLTPSLIINGTEENAYIAVMKAIHDLKAAIRYFKMDDEQNNIYRIDSDRVFAGGISAGSITAVNTTYLNHEYEIPSFISDQLDEIGGMEGNSGNEGYDSNFHGVVNLCGAVGDYNWIEPNDKPIVNMHGDADDVVPYSDQLVTLFGLNLQVYGSYIIHQTMNELEIPSALYTYEGGGHCPFENMDTVLEFTSTFLYDLVCPEYFLPGDINDDGLVNIQDVVIVINIILNISPNNEYADINNDGLVNIQDIIIIISIILN